MVADGTVSRSAEVCGWFFKNIKIEKNTCQQWCLHRTTITYAVSVFDS